MEIFISDRDLVKIKEFEEIAAGEDLDFSTINPKTLYLSFLLSEKVKTQLELKEMRESDSEFMEQIK